MSVSCICGQTNKQFSVTIGLALILAISLPSASSAQRAIPVAVTAPRAVSRVADPGKGADHYVVRRTAVGGGIGAALGAVIGFAYSGGGDMVYPSGPTISANGATTRTRRRNFTLGGAGIGAFVGSLMGYGYARSHPMMQPASTLTSHPAIDTH